MHKKQIVWIVVGAVVLAGVSFWVGKSSTIAPTLAARGQFGAMGGAGVRQGSVRPSGGGAIMGEVLSKDASGITVKLRDGGSKIVFVSNSTQVLKSAPGTIEDVSIGETVSVTGIANADGSVTAQSLQIRPSFGATSTPTAK